MVAVAEGRKIYDNILKFLVYLLSCNLSEVVLMLVAVAAGYPEPLNALQILFANIVVDIPPVRTAYTTTSLNPLPHPPTHLLHLTTVAGPGHGGD